ncbi:interleukin-11 [Onychomys torridus]|uniref:interleukin-11 n=1 Tax=Onychomys torridus TaxID=38674 RepID=UPI00167FBC8C|nr:interleukin-11 [Onychomys torridus]
MTSPAPLRPPPPSLFNFSFRALLRARRCRGPADPLGSPGSGQGRVKGPRLPAPCPGEPLACGDMNSPRAASRVSGCPRPGAPLRPGVYHLVLVVLSLWPDRAVAPGPPSGSPRVSPDPRADLDSAVLLTRSLLADTRQLAAQMRDKFPADGDHNLDSLPTLAMSAGTLGSLQLPGVLTRLRVDLMSYLRHVQWLRRAGGPSLKTLEPELGALQARLDRLLRRLQLLTSRLALPQATPDQPTVPLGPPASAWGSIRAAHAVLGGLHLTLDWAVRGLLLLKTRL